MPLPKFALLTFETFPSAYNEPNSNTPPNEIARLGLGKDGWIRELIETDQQHCVRVDNGVVILVTTEGWPLVQSLLSGFQKHQKPASLVFFDQDLFGNYTPESTRKLQTLGVVVHPLIQAG